MWVWVLEGKVSDPHEVGQQLGEWGDRWGGTPGYLGATAGVTDHRRFLLFVRWESEAAGNDLLVRPEHLEWWAKFQEGFHGEVDFAETDDVAVFLGGGSDAAGFVQGMKVVGVDRARVDAADRLFEQVAADVRPDLLGSVRVWTAPDAFTELSYFSSEDDARAGEHKELPPELAAGFADFLDMTKDAEYFDFTEPFLHSAG